MKRSSFWFSFLFFCFLVGFIHGILPGNKNTLKINIDQSTVTKNDIQSLLNPFARQENIIIEFVESTSADFIFSNQPLKSTLDNFDQLSLFRLKIHPDFLIENHRGNIPLFWQVKEDRLDIVSIIINKTANPELSISLLKYLTEWPNQIPFLLSSDYASTLRTEPHMQLSKEKKASFLRNYDLNQLKLKPL